MNRLARLLAVSIACSFPALLSAQGFGGAVAVSGDQVLVGETANRILPGVVYAYARGADGWQESGRLRAEGEAGPPDGYGRALAASGDLLFVGAPDHAAGQGTVFAYRRSGSGWSELARLQAAAGAPGDGFGEALAVSGDRVLISAPGAGNGRGAVHVFARDMSGGWTERSTLSLAASEGAQGAGFGATIALAGDLALVGAPDRRDGPGEVHAFRRDRSTDEWSHVGALEPPAGSERMGFGASLAIEEELAMVGAPGAAGRVGSVFLYRWETGQWVPNGALAPFHGTQRAQFGASIAFDGEATLVGAPGEREGVGAVYRFTRSMVDGFTSAMRVSSALVEGPIGFAATAAFGERVGVVGASSVDGRAGGAVILERTAAGTWTDAGFVVGDHLGFPAIAGDEVTCEENRAAAFECDNVNVIAFMPIKDIGGARGIRVNDIWGWTDPETSREIAIIGRTDGTSFVDLTNPSQPVFLGDLPKTAGSRSSIWRDMKVYRDHVYIVADAANEHGVQVFDLRRLRSPAAVPATFEPTYTYTGIHSAHNIVIDEESGFAYAVGSSSGGTTCGGGLHMIDLRNPSRPEFAGCFADPSTGRSGTGYSHDAQCVIYDGPDREHAGKQICLGSNETALSIADVTDKENPVALASVSYPNVAYTHQGWLSEDHRYFYQNDEGDEPQGLVEGTRTLVWDLADLDDPVLVKEYIATTPETDHNLYIRGDLMYQSNYGAGLRIIDISVPTDPVEIAFFDTTPYGGGGGSWSNYPYFESGLIVATSMGDGFFILRNTGRRHLIP